MKTTDLMIGDWVMLKHPHRAPSSERVYAVGADCVLIQTEYSRQSYELGKISPIPLTAEILEKNGFKKVVGFNAPQVGYYLEVAENVRWDLMQADGGAWLVNDCFILILYVHEFQHAMRLCGLDELADNFKV